MTRTFTSMHIILTDVAAVGYVHHLANPKTNVKGLETQAVSGVIKYFRNCLAQDPDALHVALWDGHAHWRHDLFSAYKSALHLSDEQHTSKHAYRLQVPWIKKALKYFPVVQLMHPHGEAKDLAWGLSRLLSQQGHLITLRTVNEDWLQMVNPRTRWHNARKLGELVELENFAKNSEFPSPWHVSQCHALTGYSAHGIPGFQDVTKKRANALLSQYGSIDEVLQATEDLMAFSTEPRYFHPLMTEEGRALVVRNLQLLDLSRGPALTGESLETSYGCFEELELYELLVDMDFAQLQASFPSWSKPLWRQIGPVEVSAFRRALGVLDSGWSSLKK